MEEKWAKLVDVPAKNARGETVENKQCVKWLKGHTDTITGVMYNCKDEHIASVSRKGDLILHNLASGTRAAELRDPNGQAPLVTAGDDGSIHLWDTTGRSPKVSWLKQHSAPTSGVSFSPSNDKTTSSGQIVFYDVRGKPQPITVLGAYGNSEAVTNLCWQRSKPVTVNENNCTDETVLLAGDAGDSILMPDPLPSRSSSSLQCPQQHLDLGILAIQLFLEICFLLQRVIQNQVLPVYLLQESPVRSSLLTGRTLGRLHAPRSYNFKDDMEVFSPLVEVQPITPTLDKLWDNHDGSKKDLDRKPSFLFFSQRFGSSEDGAIDNHPVSDWKPNSASKQMQNVWFSSLFPALVNCTRFSSYAERIAATPSLSETSSLSIGSPKSKKTGAETREELLNSLLRGGVTQSQNSLSQPDSQQGASFTLQLFQRTLEETLASFQKSIHEDMHNLHIEILRQFHLQEMEMSSVMRLILENQAEIMKEIQSLQKETRQLPSYCEHGWILSSSLWWEEHYGGFVDEMLQIKDRLTGEPSYKLDVVSVVGMGGSGKTTLARSIYNDAFIVYHFYTRAWVTISQEYHVCEILLDLLMSMKKLTGKKCEELAEYLYKSLKVAGILLFWPTCGYRVWNEIKLLFPDDGNGSRIILTSRISDVALYASSNSPPYNVRFLHNNESWDLLKEKVFQAENCPTELEGLGIKIALSCRGLPLAIPLVGGLLSKVQRAQNHWRNVAENVQSII
ncbi:UNVERIFIED_CONTAM: protein NEDD1 [Sesamum latifolium]|uniref:Protein NEDD1 n=1 Tax=Sesamum latifolium TaxID=2727402 RepID=A0AAW2XAY7_9LAMI